MNSSLLLVITGVVLLLIVSSYFRRCVPCEKFSAVTGFSYADGCNKMPVPENIKASSRSPPFYNLNAVRNPLCSYRNFTFPPPLGYTPIIEPDASFDKYQYWFKDAVLSHPQTAYLV